MRRYQVEGKWTELKGKARSSWGELTDDDVDQLAGKRDQLVGKLQQKYGLARDEAEKQADEWANKL
ncbi:MAG: CsbD family protein [Halomonas sp.]|nr:CsbD family protein [Halomonas sp.]